MDSREIQTHFFNDTAYFKTQDYRFWSSVWWDMYGRVGGVRGNWDAEKSAWQKRNTKVVHYPLKNYNLIGGEPSKTNRIPLEDGNLYDFPFAISRDIEAQMYADLEGSAVGLFFTHGGSIEDRFQLRRGLDVWFKAGNGAHKFGEGNLRHLFFQSCGAMSCIKEGGYSPCYRNGFRRVSCRGFAQ